MRSNEFPGIEEAVSRMEKFNRQMAAAQTLETAMDEALEQDTEVLWPPVDSSVIARDHEKYAQAEGSGNVLSNFNINWLFVL
mgnify:CR=1 FL=1